MRLLSTEKLCDSPKMTQQGRDSAGSGPGILGWLQFSPKEPKKSTKDKAVSSFFWDHSRRVTPVLFISLPTELWRQAVGELLTGEFSASFTLLLPLSFSLSLIMVNSLFQSALARSAREGPRFHGAQVWRMPKLSWQHVMQKAGSFCPTTSFPIPNSPAAQPEGAHYRRMCKKSSCHWHVQYQTTADSDTCS